MICPVAPRRAEHRLQHLVSFFLFGFSLRPTFVSAGAQSDVELLQRGSWRAACVLKGGHSKPVSVCAWAPSGRYLATAGADKKLVLWDFSQGFPAAPDAGRSGRHRSPPRPAPRIPCPVRSAASPPRRPSPF